MSCAKEIIALVYERHAVSSGGILPGLMIQISMYVDK